MAFWLGPYRNAFDAGIEMESLKNSYFHPRGQIIEPGRLPRELLHGYWLKLILEDIPSIRKFRKSLKAYSKIIKKTLWEER